MGTNSPEGSPTPRKSHPGGVLLPSARQNATDAIVERNAHPRLSADGLEDKLTGLTLLDDVTNAPQYGSVFYKKDSTKSNGRSYTGIAPEALESAMQSANPSSKALRPAYPLPPFATDFGGFPAVNAAREAYPNSVPVNSGSESAHSASASINETHDTRNNSVSTAATMSDASSELSFDSTAAGQARFGTGSAVTNSRPSQMGKSNTMSTHDWTIVPPAFGPYSSQASSLSAQGLGISNTPTTESLTQEHRGFLSAGVSSYPWNPPSATNSGLMHGSVPNNDFPTGRRPKSATSGPGVIGQPSSPTSYRYNNHANTHPHLQTAPYSQPLPQGHFPRADRSILSTKGAKGATKGDHRGKKHASGFSNSPHYGNAPSLSDRSSYEHSFGSMSRAVTPAPSFSSHPASAMSSAVSLPDAMHTYYKNGANVLSNSNLCPTAAEFSIYGPAGFLRPTPWNEQPRDVVHHDSNYMAPIEPINYRLLLDKNMSTDWSVIVDKIVYGNDQQASLFLQQKIKTGIPQHKQNIIQIIIDRGVSLMANRFGNFLIQRCMEHGSPTNIRDIADALIGHTVDLSMNAFGCHVVQKAFDYATERQKKIMLGELLGSVKHTIIHRYACHVWQKLFELRWEGEPPEIMSYVNHDLRGMWHDVALGETGSLVVQNIFENCLEEEKRPCIDEVLAQISVVATGQFGNWCIQHICEHGSTADKARAINHILHFAWNYSTDQYASKVVEKCLKVCGDDFLDKYLQRICSFQPSRSRMDLIDIAGDQYGNYLIQYILTNADPARREIVVGHIRRHMVSLRGSKYGSRVAMLCNNGTTAHGTRPPTGLLGSAGGEYERTGPFGIPRAMGYNRGF